MLQRVRKSTQVRVAKFAAIADENAQRIKPVIQCRRVASIVGHFSDHNA